MPRFDCKYFQSFSAARALRAWTFCPCFKISNGQNGYSGGVLMAVSRSLLNVSINSARISVPRQLRAASSRVGICIRLKACVGSLVAERLHVAVRPLDRWRKTGLWAEVPEALASGPSIPSRPFLNGSSPDWSISRPRLSATRHDQRKINDRSTSCAVDRRAPCSGDPPQGRPRIELGRDCAT